MPCVIDATAWIIVKSSVKAHGSLGSLNPLAHGRDFSTNELIEELSSCALAAFGVQKTIFGR